MVAVFDWAETDAGALGDGFHGAHTSSPATNPTATTPQIATRARLDGFRGPRGLGAKITDDAGGAGNAGIPPGPTPGGAANAGIPPGSTGDPAG